MASVAQPVLSRTESESVSSTSSNPTSPKAKDLNDNDNMLAQTERKVREFVEHTSEEVRHAAKKANEHIHDKPIQSSLVALGIGFVLGMLIRR